MDLSKITSYKINDRLVWSQGEGLDKLEALINRPLPTALKRTEAAAEPAQPKVVPGYREPDYSMTPDGPRDFPPTGNLEKAKAIMAKYGVTISRADFIRLAMAAGIKPTTASTYHAQLRKAAG